MFAFSATGKAMLAGGYLVLDPTYNSYVTALSARMHAVVLSGNSQRRRIAVHSPQFAEGEWVYEVKEGETLVFTEVNHRKNPFLEAAVMMVLAYINPQQPFDIEITIFSDPGFHSQENTVVRRSKNGHKQFLFHNDPIHKVPKTGLGSSACLVTIVTAGLLAYFGLDVTAMKDTVHAVAQLAHCLAQKKVGSGFDVAAAVYGSIFYRRFAPLVVNTVLNDAAIDTADPVILHSIVKSTVDKPWEFNHTQCVLPPGFRLLMGDICGGSETPKLVGTVLEWKKSQPDESAKLYAELNSANEAFMAALQQLHTTHAQNAKEYTEGLAAIGTSPVFAELVASIARMRSCLQSFTKLSGAAIEPREQTELLDRCLKLPGVAGGVVPGAGGYDAIALLVGEAHVDDIVGAVKDVQWLDLHEEQHGLVQENPKDYELENE